LNLQSIDRLNERFSFAALAAEAARRAMTELAESLAPLKEDPAFLRVSCKEFPKKLRRNIGRKIKSLERGTQGSLSQ
jgi:hypothetical protein